MGHFPQKWPIFSGSIVENDLQLRGLYGSWSPCTQDVSHTRLICVTHTTYLHHTHDLFVSHTRLICITHTTYVYHTHDLFISHTRLIGIRHTTYLCHTHNLCVSHTRLMCVTHTTYVCHTHDLCVSHTRLTSIWKDLNKRPMSIKRNQYQSKDTYINQKRRISIKRDSLPNVREAPAYRKPVCIITQAIKRDV